MHAFMLILAILGQPERATTICETYKQCSDLGAAAQAEYIRVFKREPKEFSYRVVPVLIVPEGPQT
jgi:hypothetical protein